MFFKRYIAIAYCECEVVEKHLLKAKTLVKLVKSPDGLIILVHLIYAVILDAMCVLNFDLKS